MLNNRERKKMFSNGVMVEVSPKDNIYFRLDINRLLVHFVSFHFPVEACL